MKEIKLSEVEKTPVGELGYGDVQMVRFTGTKDLHPNYYETSLLVEGFLNKHIDLHFIVEDEEYILINDNESSYQRPME